MPRYRVLLAALVACALALAPSLGYARLGGGSSMGSRGSFTYSAPPSTSTAPMQAAPMQRSLTPQAPAPSYGAPGYRAPGLGAPAFAGGGMRGGFMSGLMGGLIGAGIGGMLFGHGMFGGISGFGGFLGLLLQILLIVMVVRFLFRMFARRAAPAGGMPNIFGRDAGAAMGPAPGMMAGARPGPNVGRVDITPADFTAFEQILKGMQAAWSAHDLPRLQGMATPEMVSYFAEQLADQASRGVRNVVSDVRLEQGDLSEAWSENGREYATVAMRFSMNDVTVDGAGRVVEGDATLRTMATEIWTFVRASGGRWLLSAIQQVR
jgi:predicted lipid-binding transport protein (Tim44 family)